MTKSFKEKVFEQVIPDPYGDGTKERLAEVYYAHPQKDKDILMKATLAMQGYILFCMDSYSTYKDSLTGEYSQFPRNPDYDDWQIHITRGFMGRPPFTVTPQTDLSTLDEPFIDRNIKMSLMNKTYKQLFTYLLDGNEIS